MNKDDRNDELNQSLSDAFSGVDDAVNKHQPELKGQEVGRVVYLGKGIARVDGLAGVQLDELVQFPSGLLGFAFNLDPEEVGVILLGEDNGVQAGDEVQRTGRELDVPVGEALLGRVVDAIGRPLDGLDPLSTTERLPIERPAPPIMNRDPVNVPLQTGIKVIDALIPIGRGQRELILGDRQAGKTAIALDTILNQKDKDVLCIYCAVGQRASAVAKSLSVLKEHGAMDYTAVIMARAEDVPGLQFITPYAATSVAEYFMEQGRDVLIVYDDLTRHAWAYRELSLLLRRPPGREAYPGDVFYIHSRLLERSTRLREKFGGGSLTALPIIETEAQNVSAYIPTNLISITDGQIYLSPTYFQKGILPSVDVGKSVSRVGGKAQLEAYRAVAADLRLSYSQFEELEDFSRFDTRLDEKTKSILKRGRQIREVLKQDIHQPLPVPEQLAVLVAVIRGVFDPLPLERIVEVSVSVGRAVKGELPDQYHRILDGESLRDQDLDSIQSMAEEMVRQHLEESGDGGN